MSPYCGAPTEANPLPLQHKLTLPVPHVDGRLQCIGRLYQGPQGSQSLALINLPVLAVVSSWTVVRGFPQRNASMSTVLVYTEARVQMGHCLYHVPRAPQYSQCTSGPRTPPPLEALSPGKDAGAMAGI